jgi:hypothetical protein
LIFDRFWTDGEKDVFVGPGPRALIYVKLTFWATHYQKYSRFPYPRPIEECYVQGKFTEFRLTSKVPWWKLDCDGFDEYYWLKEEFFMQEDLWTLSVPSKAFIVDRAIYDQWELNYESDEVNDEDLEPENEDMIDESTNSSSGPGALPLGKSSDGSGKHKGRPPKSNNVTQVSRRLPKRIVRQVEHSESDDDSSSESEEEQKVDNDDAVDNIEFKAPVPNVEHEKPIPPIPDFIRGLPRGTDDPKNAFRDDKPEVIVEFFMQQRFRHQLERFNEKRERKTPSVAAFTYGELKTYYGILTYMSVVKLPDEQCYWDPKELSIDGLTLPNFSEIMSISRWRQIKACRNYYTEDDREDDDPAWKVRTEFNLFKDLLEQIMKYPGQVLSFDEAMMKCCTKRNPIRRVLPNKPIPVGFKFWVLADKETGCVVKINLDSSFDLSKDMTKHTPGGFYGHLVINAVSSLPGRNYVLAIDKLFTSPQLALKLLDYDVRSVGPVKYSKIHKYLGPGIRMSNAKKAKPSRENPRGKITKGHTPAGDCHVFGFMDSSCVYFLTTHQGYSVNSNVCRNLPSGRTAYLAPTDINWYNTNMNAVDVLDQCRTGDYVIERSRVMRWTDVFIMGLYSWTLTNSYLLYKHFRKGNDATARCSHSAFQMRVAQAFIFNAENKEMHQRLSRKPSSVTRAPTTSQLPTGFYHSLQEYSKGRGTDDSRKIRFACSVCPVDPTGSKGKCSTYCLECKVPVHGLCFAALHNNPAFLHKRQTGHKETIAYLEGN